MNAAAAAATATATEVNAEARRVLAVSISKLYASRSQRGGLRLHRSLLLSLVMRSARDIYHSSRDSECAPPEPMDTGAGDEPPQQQPEPEPEPQAPFQAPLQAPLQAPPAEEETSGAAEEVCYDAAEDKENLSPARHSRKRRGKLAAAPDFLPSKRARLEPGEERHAAAAAAAATALPASCRAAAAAADTLTALSLNRVIPAF